MKCPSCRRPVSLRPEEHLCPHCGVAIRESVEEMNARIASEQAAHSVRRARMWILIAALVTLAVGLFFPAMAATQLSRVPLEAQLALWSTAAFGVVLFVLWMWAAWSPLAATLIALILYAGATAATVAAAPGEALVSPLAMAFRIFVLVSLLGGVRAALRHRKLRAAHLGS